MSFVQEVLNAAETVNLDTLNKEVPSLLERSVHLRQDIHNYAREVYLTYSRRPSNIKKILEDTESAVEQATHLRIVSSDLIKHKVVGSRELVKQFDDELETIDCYLRVTESLCLLNNEMLVLRRLHKERSFEATVLKILEMDEHFAGLSEEEYVPGVRELCTAFRLEKAGAILAIEGIIQANFFTRSCEIDGTTTNTITIKDGGDEVQRALIALSTYRGEHVRPLDAIVDFLWEHVLTQIVSKSTRLAISDEEGCATASLFVTGDKKMPYSHVFGGLIEVSEFLCLHFDCKLKGDTCLGYISANIRDNLSELIVESCLKDTIPTNEEELEKYDKVVDETKRLQQKLIDSCLLEENSTSLTDYVANVEALYIVRKCERYDEMAVNLMTMDLHQVETVGASFNPLNFNIEQFPQCSVSTSVPRLLALVEKVLAQVVDPTDKWAFQLSDTARGMLAKYPVVVQEHHKKMLQTIPQQVAIYRNNCSYIAFELHENKFCELLKRIPTTVDFSFVRHRLDECGLKLFEEYLQEQIGQIEKTIRSSGIDVNPSCEVLAPTVAKDVRQCLRQQELLKTVWQKVLDYHTYNRSMGRLLGSLSDSLVTSVLNVEDISSEAGERLVEVFRLVMTRGPKVFTDPKEVHMYVASWHRFSELLFVLHSGLVDIHDRWADGQGPLALHFKPQEMRTLIRALFQNTTKRADILASI